MEAASIGPRSSARSWPFPHGRVVRAASRFLVSCRSVIVAEPRTGRLAFRSSKALLRSLLSQSHPSCFRGACSAQRVPDALAELVPVFAIRIDPQTLDTRHEPGRLPSGTSHGNSPSRRDGRTGPDSTSRTPHSHLACRVQRTFVRARVPCLYPSAGKGMRQGRDPSGGARSRTSRPGPHGCTLRSRGTRNPRPTSPDTPGRPRRRSASGGSLLGRRAAIVEAGTVPGRLRRVQLPLALADRGCPYGQTTPPIAGSRRPAHHDLAVTARGAPPADATSRRPTHPNDRTGPRAPIATSLHEVAPRL